jgi:DNA-binding XRE family transcriptional regulator
MKSEDDGLVILGGAEVDLDLLTETYTDIPDQVEVLLPISGGEVYKLLFKPLPRRSELDASARDAQRFYQTLSKQAGNKKHTNNLRKLRIERMMSKAELARRANLSVLTIDRIEKGFGCRMDSKRKILEALGLSLADRVRVFGEEE